MRLQKVSVHQLLVRKFAIVGAIPLQPIAARYGWSLLARLDETHTETGIPAEVHTDDERRKLKFDALPWFEQASDQKLRELAACGFGGDYPADQVAYFFETGSHQLPAVADLFDYLAVVNRALPDGTDMIGFECHVDAEAAGEWLHRHRPHLL